MLEKHISKIILFDKKKSNIKMIYLKEDKAQKLKRKRPLCFEHLLRKYMYLQYANYHTELR